MLTKLQARFDLLTTREKIIVVATLLISVWSLWDSFFYQDAMQQQTLLSQKLSNIDNQINAQRKTIEQLENNTYVDPNLANQNKLAHLQQQLTQLQEQMTVGDKKFVPPQLMPRVLEEMLSKSNALTLVNLNTLPITTLLPVNEQHPIYKHGLTLTFSGTYLNTLNFLNALENLPWAFIWDNLEYNVKNHPNAEVSIRVYTLSFEEKWLDI